MKHAGLIARSIRGNGFRSLVVVFSAAVLVTAVLATTMILRGAEADLRLQQARLGADIVVIPEGLGGDPTVQMDEPMTGMDHGPVGGGVLDGALFTGKLADGWMPASTLEAVSRVRGVAGTSPQLYVASMGGAYPSTGAGAQVCPLLDSMGGAATGSMGGMPGAIAGSTTAARQATDSPIHLVAYNPSSDFVIRPWLGAGASGDLQASEAVGGSALSVPEGEGAIQTFGYNLLVKGRLDATGTSLDRTLFFDFDTAREIISAAQVAPGMCCCAMGGMMGSNAGTMAGMPDGTTGMASGMTTGTMDSMAGMMAAMMPKAPPDTISAVLVKVSPEADTRLVANQIFYEVPGVTVVESTGLYQSFRGRLGGLVQGAAVVLAIIWMVSVLVIALVFSVVVNERRREIAVLRALGSTRRQVLRSLLAEALLLALAGGLLGSLLAGAAAFGLRGPVMELLELSYLLPSPMAFLTQAGAVLALTLASVLLAALFPVFKASRQDPALAMRE